MTQIENDLKRFSEAVNTIEQLLPTIRGYLSVVRGMVETEKKEKSLWQFIKENGGSMRLQNVIRSLPDIHHTTTISEFIARYSKINFLKTRNCGKMTLIELDNIFKNSLIIWK